MTAAKLARAIPLFERVQLETQAACNRACWFCPRTYDRSGKYLDREGRSVVNRMPTEKVLDVLDQLVDLGFRGSIGFHHYSEPLLDRRNPDLAMQARERGLRPYLHTNGDPLRVDEDLCARVLEAYDLIVVGLYDYREQEGLDAEMTFWRKRLPGVELRFSAIPAEGGRAVKNMSVPKALVPPDPRMGAPDFLYPNAPCLRPLIRLIVQHDGTMCNCCEDDAGAFDLGNVYETPIADLWWSDRHSRVVRDLMAGRRDRHALCSRCPLSPSGPPLSGNLEILPRRAAPSG